MQFVAWRGLSEAYRNAVTGYSPWNPSIRDPEPIFVNDSDDGDEAAIAFRDAIEKAEALAESETVRNVRQASKLPQFWAAGMTYLERKHPERWGRRQEDSAAPKVVVNIGVRDSDVQVQVLSPSVSEDLHRLTADDSAS